MRNAPFGWWLKGTFPSNRRYLIACVLSPDVWVLMLARFLQGFGGGWAMVIGRAVIVDLAHGPQLVRVLNLVMGIGGVAPIISPLLGAVILQLTAPLFAYVATSAFILQNMNGLSPVAYSVVFAVNAGGSFFALMVAQGLINTNGGALASAEVPEHPGTSSAVLGLVQWTTAGIVAPIAGLGGADTAIPMALLMIGGALLSLFGLLVLARPHTARPPAGHITDGGYRRR